MFLGEEWDEEKLMSIYNNITHLNVAQQVKKDSRVIDKDHANGKYISNKQQFMILHGEYISNQFKGLWK